MKDQRECVLFCAPGTTGSVGTCTTCDAGTYKPNAGSAECTGCNEPRSRSLSGSTAEIGCFCSVGTLDIDPESIFFLLETTDYANAVIQSDLTAASVVSHINFPGDASSNHVKIYLERNKKRILVYECLQSYCTNNAVIQLYDIHAMVVVEGTSSASLYVRNELTVKKQQNSVVSYPIINIKGRGPLYANSTFFNQHQVVKSTQNCLLCPPGLVCK